MSEQETISQIKSIVLKDQKENSQIKEGDVVRLKTHGPHMVVDSIDFSRPPGSQPIKCIWFGYSEDVLSEGFFNSNSLILIKRN